MARALELARRAERPSPNPRVGCVIVRDGQIISEGWHDAPGHPHAEVIALNNLAATADARNADLYVTLEPCAHHGRTPPCTDALVASGVARVVVAQRDPDPRVSGKGIEALRGAGIDVVEGVLGEAARRLNAAYLRQRSTGAAFLTLKLALSLDGRLAAPDRSARWITGPGARKRVHELRRAADAVLVGSGTVLADDPALDVREVPVRTQPLRVVVDARGRVPASARVFDDAAPTLIVTSDMSDHERHVAWKQAGAEVLVLEREGEHVDGRALLAELGRRGILEVFCEGGAELATALLRADLVDRLVIHQGAVVIGAGGPEIGPLGVASLTAARRYELWESEVAGDDVLTIYGRRTDRRTTDRRTTDGPGAA